MSHETLADNQKAILTSQEYSNLALMDVDSPTDEQNEMLARFGIVVDGENVPVSVLLQDGTTKDVLFCASKSDFGTNIVLDKQEPNESSIDILPVVHDLGQEAVEESIELEDEAAAYVDKNEQENAHNDLSELMVSAKEFLESQASNDQQRAKQVELLTQEAVVLNGDIKNFEQTSYTANYVHEQTSLVYKIEQFIDSAKKIIESVNAGNDTTEAQVIANRIGDSHDTLAAQNTHDQNNSDTLSIAHDIGLSIIEISHKSIDCNQLYGMLRNIDQMTHDGQATVSDIQVAMQQLLVQLDDVSQNCMYRARLASQTAANVSI